MDSYLSKGISPKWNADLPRIWTWVAESITNDDNCDTECASRNIIIEDIYYIYLLCNQLIGLEVRVFASGPGDRGSIPGCVIPKTLKMVLYTSLLNTQQYKVRIKGKVEQSRERSSGLPYTSVK